MTSTVLLPEAGTEQIVASRIDSPLGQLLIGATGEGICLVEFGDERRTDRQPGDLHKHFACEMTSGTNEHLDQLAVELAEYFEGRRQEFTVRLVYPGTAFQVRVWDALQKIPYGQTWSYEALAQEIGCPNAQRAVGMANGRNRIGIVIPCHRVVNKGGKLGGYGGGLWRKEFLLKLEQDHRR